MKRWALRIGGALAILFLVMTFVHASWLAPEPKGAAKLIAHRGIHQLYDHEGVGRDTCTADRIEQPYHDYLENTVASIRRASEMGVHMIEVDIAPTKDGEIAVFHDWAVDCRTDGSGDTRDFTMEELKALDAGHGYTADGGATYPFRGKYVGAIPTLEEAVAAPYRARLIYNFKSKDPAEADLLIGKLKALGRDIGASGDAFYGHEGPIGRVRELAPEAWAFTTAQGKQCSTDYVTTGWTGMMPDSCKGGTMFIPLDSQWAFWGWPNRLLARAEEHGTRVVMLASRDPEAARGLTLPEQVREIPASFNGYVWVEDAWTIAPALYPSFDKRRSEEREAAEEALERRRAAQ